MARGVRHFTAALAAACIAVAAPEASFAGIDEHGFTHAELLYGVDFGDAAARRFLPDEWILDNYEPPRTGPKAFTPRSGPAYRGLRRVDVDGDGKLEDHESYRTSHYDLRFVHTLDNGVLALSSRRLLTRDATRSLDAMLRNIVESLSGVGHFMALSDGDVVRTESKEFAATIRERKAGPLGAPGSESISAVVDVANLSRLALDPGHRHKTIAIDLIKVAVRPEAPLPIPAGKGEEGAWSGFALLVLVYQNDPEDFDRGYAAFEAVRAKLWLGHRAPGVAAAVADRGPTMGPGQVLFPASGRAASAVLAEQGAARLEVRVAGGAVLRGKVVSVERGHIWFDDEAAHLLDVDPSTVVEVRRAPPLPEAPAGVEVRPEQPAVRWERGEDLARLSAQVGRPCEVELASGERVAGVLIGATAEVLVLREPTSALRTLALAAVARVSLPAFVPPAP